MECRSPHCSHPCRDFQSSNSLDKSNRHFRPSIELPRKCRRRLYGCVGCVWTSRMCVFLSILRNQLIEVVPMKCANGLLMSYYHHANVSVRSQREISMLPFGERQTVPMHWLCLLCDLVLETFSPSFGARFFRACNLISLPFGAEI